MSAPIMDYTVEIAESFGGGGYKGSHFVTIAAYTAADAWTIAAKNECKTTDGSGRNLSWPYRLWPKGGEPEDVKQQITRAQSGGC